ncbi:ankyrin, partial [Colletotrichum zoysiae]
IVKLLLDTDKVDINSKDLNSRTPLSWASGNGHEAIITILLANREVEVDAGDRQSGRTPLSFAAGNGHEAAVRTLLDAGKAETNSKDVNGRTPFSWAAMNGHETVVATLL